MFTSGVLLAAGGGHDADWGILYIVLVLLAAALVLGTVAERLRQSAVVGYLLAGMLVGPHVLGLVDDPDKVAVIAELGVALLLFTIGLEFSFARLTKLGAVALGGGSLQVGLTVVVVTGLTFALFGLGFEAALAVGCMAALSSTAIVLRLLTDRAETESPHGRNATGILLMQDVAVLPLTLIVAALAGGGTAGAMLLGLGRTLLFAALLVAGFFALFNVVVPRLLNLREWARNREFPILLAVVLALGSAAAAFGVGVSPAIGAFIAGVLLAASPFAVQVRADVASLRTALVTLFFASVGLIAEPAWALANLPLVLGVTALVLAGKALVVLLVLSLPIKGLKQQPGVAAATGLCIAQVGEFSFVLAKLAYPEPPAVGLIGEDTFRLILSVSVLTLLVTPYVVAAAPRLSGYLQRVLPTDTWGDLAPTEEHHKSRKLLVIGFGPAGQRVAEDALAAMPDEVGVLDLNPRAVKTAERYGLPVRVGDATQEEVLEHAGLRSAEAVVVTLPDPNVVRQVVQMCRTVCPTVTIVARSRYHAYRWEMMLAGAEVVVDEEDEVGKRLSAEAQAALGLIPPLAEE